MVRSNQKKKNSNNNNKPQSKGKAKRSNPKQSSAASLPKKNPPKNKNSKGTFGPLRGKGTLPPKRKNSSGSKEKQNQSNFLAPLTANSKKVTKKKKKLNEKQAHNHHLLREARLPSGAKWKIVPNKKKRQKEMKKKLDKKNQKKSRPKLKIALPQQAVLLEEMPWQQKSAAPPPHREEVAGRNQETRDSAAEAANTCFCTDRLPEAGLDQLDAELDQFANYVKLTPLECEAREYLIQHVSNLTGQTFSKQSPQRKRGRPTCFDINVEDIRLQAFGSYATPDVCMFASDVDLAVWGLVPLRRNTHTRFHQENDGNEDNEEKSEPASTATSTTTRESRLEKWRQALAELDAVDGEDSWYIPPKDDKTENDKCKITSRSEGVLREDTAAETTQTSEEPANNSPEGLPLFVLDYNGAVADPALKGESSLTDNDKAEAGREQNDEVVETNVDAALLLNEEDPSTGEEDGPEVVDLVSSDSEDDSADKLEGLGAKFGSLVPNAAQVTLSPSTSGDEDQDNEKDEEDGFLEVSLVENTKEKSRPTIGPNGETRKMVMKRLKLLGRAVNKSPVVHKAQVINARVPIIQMETRLGFEADVAVGGHNGADTSQYASSQVARFRSFAPTVLFLKTLLNQQSLDKPFTGGLGSYKLYVLVAHHLEQHIALGGTDRPSEVLLNFLYRFGFCDKRKASRTDDGLTTKICQETTLHSDGGEADLSNVFRVEECCETFQLAFSRMLQQLRNQKGQSQHSLLSLAIHVNALKDSREAIHKKAGQFKTFAKRTDNAERAPTQKKSTSENSAGQGSQCLPPPSTEITTQGDLDEAELLRGYGMMRDTNGELVPRGPSNRKRAGGGSIGGGSPQKKRKLNQI